VSAAIYWRSAAQVMKAQEVWDTISALSMGRMLAGMGSRTESVLMLHTALFLTAEVSRGD